jgi:hypothetical protein
MGRWVMEWSEIPIKSPPPKWKIGPRVWRVDGEWRIRLYRPWSDKRLIEIQSPKLLWNVYILGIAAGWWKDVGIDETPSSKGPEVGEGS